MANKPHLSIKDHLNDEELEDLIKEYDGSVKVYKRLLFIQEVKNGITVQEVANKYGFNVSSGYRLCKAYNENGLEGLEYNYKNCGRKSNMTIEQEKLLEKHIDESDEFYDIKKTKKWIFDNFGIDYSYTTVWRKLRKKIGFNYRKGFVTCPKRSENAKEELKKTKK